MARDLCIAGTVIRNVDQSDINIVNISLYAQFCFSFTTSISVIKTKMESHTKEELRPCRTEVWGYMEIICKSFFYVLS